MQVSLWFTVLLSFINFANANYNSDTIQVYEEKFQEYISTTPQKVSGGFKKWIDKSLSCITKQSTIFEIGSAFGRDAEYIKSCGYNLQTSDVAKNFIKVLRKKGFYPKEFNLLEDKFDQTYDMIFANSVLLHFNGLDLANAVFKINNALNDGGIFAFAVKPGKGEKWSSHKVGAPRYYFLWQPDEIQKFISGFGFEVLYLEKTLEEGKIFVIARKIKKMKVSEFSLILKPSTIPDAGIGAFAVRDLPEGEVVSNSKNIPHVVLHRNDIPDEFVHYCIAQGNDMWLCPKDFNKMECAWFINHSDTPNIGLFFEGEDRLLKTIRNVEKGEELVMDYNELDEPEHEKESYYKK